MTKKLFYKVFSFPVFLATVLAGAAYHFGNAGVADPDIWWHLRNAEYLVKTHHFIHSDMYSYTVAGTPWMNHEWLSEIPYYLAWKAWGLQGLFVVKMLLIEAVTLGIYYLGCVVSGNPKSAFLGSWVAVFLTTVSFGPRTLLFGWMFLIIELAVLWRYKEQGKDQLWVLPPLFMLWINCHGSWMIGMGVFAIFIVSGLLEGTVGLVEAKRWSPTQLRKLLTVAGISVLMLFINPYGYKLVFYPFDFASRIKLGVANVQEWASVDFHGLSGKILLGAIFLMLAITFLRKQNWTLESFLLFFLAIYSSVTYVRFLFLAGIIFAPLIARRLDMVPSYEREKDKPLINAAFVLALVIFIIVRFPSTRALADDVESVYPKKASEYLQSRVQQRPGPVFNDYLWGGYLILNCQEVPVYVDSRVDIFEYKGFIKEYLEAIRLSGSLEIMDKHKVQYALLTSEGALTYLLKHNPNWKIDYSDKVAVVFERVN